FEPRVGRPPVAEVRPHRVVALHDVAVDYSQGVEDDFIFSSADTFNLKDGAVQPELYVFGLCESFCLSGAHGYGAASFPFSGWRCEFTQVFLALGRKVGRLALNAAEGKHADGKQ